MSPPNEPYGAGIAYSGPRDMLPKESSEYARRSIIRLQALWAKLDNNEREFEEMLTEIEEAGIPGRWPAMHPYGTLESLVRAELGISLAFALQRVATAKERRAASLADASGKSLHGGDHKSAVYKSMSDSDIDFQDERAMRAGVHRDTQRKNDRLKRDYPELAARVASGELTTNGAAILAGFQKATVSIPKEPAAAARLLARHFQGNALAELIAALTRASQS